MSCVYDYAVCVTRGTTFSLDVGLAGVWDEIVADPSDWEAALIFRATQSDLSPALLTLIAAPEIQVDPLPGAPVIYFRFQATAVQTAALPANDLVHYVDLREVVPGHVRRLFEGKVEIHD